MSHQGRRVRLGILTSLIAVLGTWLVLTAAVSGQRNREDGVSVAVQSAIDRSTNASDKAVTELRGRLDLISAVATDARDEVREMRRAVWGLAATILISLFMQVAQIKKSKGGA